MHRVLGILSQVKASTPGEACLHPVESLTRDLARDAAIAALKLDNPEELQVSGRNNLISALSRPSKCVQISSCRQLLLL